MASRADKRKFHYIYKITRHDGKYYIGMHSTDDLEDGYFGSGQLLWKSIKKHGKDAHVKEIIERLPSREALKLREAELVTKEIIDDPLCMNLKLGGEGGWDHQNNSSEIQARKGAKGRARMVELAENTEWVTKRSVNQSAALAKSHADGTRVAKWSEEASLKANSPEAKAKRMQTFTERNYQQGAKNSQFGTRWAWVNKDTVKRKVPLEQLETFLTDGWKRGLK